MHIPVLYQEVIDYLEPSPGASYIDATLGAGGHTLGLLKASAPDGIVLALDRDPMAIEFARKRLNEFEDRAILVNASYEQMAVIASRQGLTGVNGIVMDLGLSSDQLADRDRGFSFQEEGPLDMRFDTSRGSTAADLLNALSEEDIAGILRRYGDIQESKRYARAIIGERPIESTTQLAGLIKNESRSRGKIHPATRVFQAIRIAVNEELEILRKGLTAATEILKIGGRVAVISYHSLEDRIVKHFIRESSRDCVCPPEFPVCVCEARPILRAVHRKVIRPSETEIRSNPRSRSARMRVAEKIAEVRP
jgi:16S rRNA (cytosine1402-N4)-methyltransferase